ncbi:DNA-binding transcriptional regulator, GntR family [Gordonia malaquae]|uniref:Putative GntR family transcriptional regulator n=1 Tax=Gordonia malaquae NBRC 108250 TaxID=1223542 RepID=M3UYY8_GORML|nr:GntR family transcriptional regulator [Gordonia malaquae]GAC81147.1 putative GntR family transcriptional regulator [Gordonia malaquae NBRC 108250]SEC01476.1 DNA-binding transcriptional regulator, GntR family [Gordonia malaquae]
MPRPSMPRRQLTEVVADDLRIQIMTGKLRAGDFVRLDETAIAYGCSVTPVREALVTLRGEGLVRSSRHRGFIVETLTRRDVTDIFWIQAELSARLATQAAESDDIPDRLPELTAIVDDIEAAVKDGASDDVIAGEFTFHRTINIMADSKKVAWFLTAASRYSPYDVYVHDRAWGESAVASHRRLIKLLEARDKDGIADEIRTQFGNARDRLVKHLESVGFWTASPSA